MGEALMSTRSRKPLLMSVHPSKMPRIILTMAITLSEPIKTNSSFAAQSLFPRRNFSPL
jgi:hypothetical protein